MTARERIEAAIAARDTATPGPLKVVFKGTIGKYTVGKQEGGVHKQLAYCGYSDALLFAAAPDLVDEVVRLRNWQQEAVRWLEGARTTMELVGAPKDMKDNLDRLIAKAQDHVPDAGKKEE